MERRALSGAWSLAIAGVIACTGTPPAAGPGGGSTAPAPPAASVAVDAWVAVGIDRTLPSGDPLPDPATLPLPAAPLDDPQVLRDPLLIGGELQSLTSLLQTTPRDHPDRPMLIMRLAKDYRELRLASTDAAIAAQAAASEASYLRMRLDEHPKWCASPNPGNPMASTGCADEALFQLGRSFEAVANVGDARKVYFSLIRDWPASRLVPRVYFAFGEMFQAQDTGDLAQQTYAKVIEFAGDPLVPYARHRLARVAWRAGDLARALSELRRVTQAGAPAALMSAARADLAAVYALAADPGRAVEALSGIDGAFAQVRRYYLGAARYADLVTLDQALLATPSADDCALQLELLAVTAFAPGFTPDLADDHAIRALAVAAAQATAGDPAAPTCAAQTLALAVTVAMAWDADAVGTRDGGAGSGDAITRARAGRLYRAIAGQFTDAEVAVATFARLPATEHPTRAELAARGAALAP